MTDETKIVVDGVSIYKWEESARQHYLPDNTFAQVFGTENTRCNNKKEGEACRVWKGEQQMRAFYCDGNGSCAHAYIIV